MIKEKSRTISKKLYPILEKCENCGTNIKLERHHSDYNKPESIIVLCKKCHIKWHKENKSINGEKRTSGKFIIFQLKLDKKLREQLQRYADRNDEGLASVSARKALRKFLESDYRKSKNADTLKLEGYKDQDKELKKTL